MINVAAATAGQAVEVWPENWPSFRLFYRMNTQWNYAAVRMGAREVGLNYTVLLALMDRLDLDKQDFDAMFDDIQTLEAAALKTLGTTENND